MKIALVQSNPLIGDLTGNREKIREDAARAAGLGCRLAVFPELALSGYPPQDLLERPAFLADHEQALNWLLAEVRGIGVLCGAVTRNPSAAGKPLHNSALLFEDGRLLGQVVKRLLPTYDVFDEARYFEPGGPAGVVDFHGLRLAITVCEDIWNDAAVFARCLYRCDPVAELLGSAGGGADLLLNLSASPYHLGKNEVKQRLFANLCARYRVPLVHVNQVGGQDSLIFEGGSLALDQTGRLVCRAARFREDLVVLDTGSWQGEMRREAGDNPAGLGRVAINRALASETALGAASGTASGMAAETVLETPLETDSQAASESSPASSLDRATLDPAAAEVLAALILGTGDYVRKCGFSGVVLGLSGGIDSALTAVIAVRALGPENVLGLAMPSPYSAPASLEDARLLATNLGIAFAELPITPIFAAFRSTLAPLFAGDAAPGRQQCCKVGGDQAGAPASGGSLSAADPLAVAAAEVGLTEQNIQARIRGNLLMAAANKFGRLLLTTGNKSEMAVGYCTLYGDMSGGLAPLADLPKTLVYRLARLLNRDGVVIPARTLTRPPSAELAPDQQDQDDLPPYETLDPILQAYLEDQLPLGEIVNLGYDRTVVADIISRVRRSEHKRRQAPPGLKVTSKAFGPGRRYPIAENYREE